MDKNSNCNKSNGSLQTQILTKLMAEFLETMRQSAKIYKKTTNNKKL